MFDNIKARFEKHYIRIDQLRRYVELGVITHEEFEQICGEPYSTL